MNVLSFLHNISSMIWIQIFLILAIATMLRLIVRTIFNRIKKIKSIPEWIKILCFACYHPSAWLIWGCATLLILEASVEFIHLIISGELIAKARHIFVISMISWIFLRWKATYEKVLLKSGAGKKPSNTQEKALIVAIGKILSVVVFTFIGLIVLDIVNIPLTGLLAFGGVGGAAIGFAAKDVVANYFGGLMIHINRPFSVGEWIMSPNKNFEGIVEEIGWYMTRIRTFARRPTYIPNALFIDSIIENPGRMYNRRIKETIGIRYQDAGKIKSIAGEIESMLKKHPDIDQDQILFVHFLAFGPYSLDIEVYCYTKTIDWGEWRSVQQSIFLDIIQLIESHGAEIAFPTSHIHLEKPSDPPAPKNKNFNQDFSLQTSVIP